MYSAVPYLTYENYPKPHDVQIFDFTVSVKKVLFRSEIKFRFRITKAVFESNILIRQEQSANKKIIKRTKISDNSNFPSNRLINPNLFNSE
jgi:hypothetical protein